MVIFNFLEEGTGAEHVAVATSKCKQCGIYRKVQHPCQVSIAFIYSLYPIRLCNRFLATVDLTISYLKHVAGGVCVQQSRGNNIF